jgi:erythromycin esterase-like protein
MLVTSWQATTARARFRHVLSSVQRAAKGAGGTRQEKVVIWAHNPDVGNASATAMGWHCQFDTGDCAAQRRVGGGANRLRKAGRRVGRP